MSNGKTRARKLAMQVIDTDMHNKAMEIFVPLEDLIQSAINSACREALDEAKRVSEWHLPDTYPVYKISGCKSRIGERILELKKRYADGKEGK